MTHEPVFSVDRHHLLEKDFLLGSHKNRLVLLSVLLIQLQEDIAPLRLELLWNLIFHDGGLGSFSSGIFENMCLVEGHFLEESHSLCKFLLSLPGEAHDHIGGQRRMVEILS